MRAARLVAPLTLAALLGCQDRADSGPDPLAPSAIAPATEVIRFVSDEGFLIHTVPTQNIAFTVGLLTPPGDFEECGGPGGLADFDVKLFLQTVVTPAGPLRSVDRITGTFVVYDVFLPGPDLCPLATAPVIGRGVGSFTKTDNSVTGVGPGMNAFGFQANAMLELTGGGKARFHAVGRWLYDGVDVRMVVDDAEIRPIGH
jgi:hypothetical protein